MSSISPMFCLVSLVASFFTIGALGAGDDEKCAAGKIRVKGDCVRCPAGTFREKGKPNVCSKCPIASFNGATGVEYADMCRPCYPGTYADETGSTKCKPCPTGKFSSHGAKKCSYCPPGKRFVLYGQGCENCPLWSYSSLPNTVVCTACKEGHKAKPGSTKPSDCVPCSRNEGCSEICREGQYRPFGKDDCYYCPLGTTTSVRSAHSIEQCMPCPKDTYRWPVTSIGKCEKCSPPRKTSAPGGVYCRADNERCPIDTFEHENGNCMVCDSGYKFIKTEKRCQLCGNNEVGRGGLSETCIRCQGNTKPDRERKFCACSAGSVLASPHLCKMCPRGTHNPYDLYSKAHCGTCNVDMAARDEGETECKACPDGFLPNEDRSGCRKCREGLVPNYIRQPTHMTWRRGHWFCIKPQTGCEWRQKRKNISFSDTYECERPTCPRNATKAEIGTICSGCRKGYKMIYGESPYCTPCGDREVSEGGVSTTCKKCPNNFESDSKDGSKCVCDGSSGMGLELVNGMCRTCRKGTYASRSDNKCRKCPGGTFSVFEGLRSCWICSQHEFAPPGSDLCRDCPKGFSVNKMRRATKCLPTMT